MAAFQTSCGQESCHCSCLFWDLELAKAWLNTARQYFELTKRPCKDIVPRQLLQPWKLTTLQEHEACFQQWNVLQLWIGIISALVMFVMNFIWHVAEPVAPQMGSIIVNALVAIFLSVFLAHLAWFGVLQKHGCCCFVLCCCLGQPNLLVTAILSVVFGILAVISVIDAFSYSIPGALLVLVLIAAVFVVIHAVTLIYVGFEAFMIWRLYLGNDGNGTIFSRAAT